MALYLVRHGATAWTASGQHTGLTDLPLSEEGIAQAKQLRTRLEKIRFSQVIVSPLKRAIETCKLAGLSSKAKTDPNLIEWNYGKYEGLTHEEILLQNPKWDLFVDGCPGGESVEQICKRADLVLSSLEKLSGNVLLFSSGHLLRTLATRWLKVEPSFGDKLALSPASISILDQEHKLPAIIRWNG